MSLTPILVTLIGCSKSSKAQTPSPPHSTSTSQPTSSSNLRNIQSTSAFPSFPNQIDPYTYHKKDQREVAIFAGGCFWCMEDPFEQIDGVEEVISGYTGGQRSHPTYSQVSAGETEHFEAVIVFFNPQVVSFTDLVEIFWHNINPTQADGQFADRGHQYQTALFYLTEDQKQQAQASKDRLSQSKKFDQPLVTEVLKGDIFWPAEDYHQNYYKTNTQHYLRYKYGSGRAGYIKRVWGSSK